MDNSAIMKLASEEAIWKLQNAQECRAHARSKPDGADQKLLGGKADKLEAEAQASLELTGGNDGAGAIGVGGEMAPALAELPRNAKWPATPDLVTVDASRVRLSLVSGVGVLQLALDAAEGANATSGIEQMLAHQTAAAHAMALQMGRMGMGALTRHEAHNYQHSFLGTEGIRLVVASARLMEASQRAALALNRLKTAGKQTLVVQHVHVGDGGKAVVAGAIQRDHAEDA